MKQTEAKVALVMGGSRGIGAATAKRLAREGIRVALTYLNSPADAETVTGELNALGHEVKAYRADSADPQAVQKVIGQVAAEFGRLDILVNNAGLGVLKPLDQLTLDDFEGLIKTNVRSVFVGAQIAARHMSEGGRIVIIGSCNAERVPGPNMSLYDMSKSALVGLTKGLARDLGPRGVTVNLVQPGPTDTDMNPAAGPFAEPQRGLLATGRFVSPDEVAGATLNIDGGYTA